MKQHQQADVNLRSCSMSSDFVILAAGSSSGPVAASSFASQQPAHSRFDFELPSPPLTQSFASGADSSFFNSNFADSLASTRSQSTQITAGDFTGSFAGSSSRSASISSAPAQIPDQILHIQHFNLPHLKARTANLQQQMDTSKPKAAGVAKPPFKRPPQPSLTDPTLNWQPAFPVSVKTVPVVSNPQTASTPPPTLKSGSGRAEVKGLEKGLLIKLKVPKGRLNRKAYDAIVAGTSARKRKFDEMDDEEFVGDRVTEKKLKAQQSVTMRPIRGTRQKDAAAATKHQKELEMALQAIEADAEEQDKKYWGTSKKRAPARGGKLN